MIGIDYDWKISALIKSNLAFKENYFNSLVKDINNTDILDQGKIATESYNMFVKKIKNGSLKIKCLKTKNNHSKTFIFKFSEKFNMGGLTPGYILSGSSNFTKSGFLTNIEKNRLFREKVDFEQELKVFQEDWNSEDCIDIAVDKNFEEFETKVV